jgi:hypothetical protein
MVLEECRRERVQCSSHASSVVPVGDAAAGGQSSVEHLFFLPDYTSRDERQLLDWKREADRPAFWQRVLYRLGLRQRPPPEFEAEVATHDSVKARALFRTLARHRTRVTPTLMLWTMMAHIDPAAALTRDDAYYVGQRGPEFQAETRNVETLERTRRMQSLLFRLVREMRDEGVALLAGTDAPELAPPGFSLHSELAQLVRAGLTPAEALRAATAAPAAYLDRLDSLGTVSAGRAADLVLLRSNPLQEIGATRDIQMVVIGGRMLNRSQLDSLLAYARSAADTLRARLAARRSTN